MKKLLAGSFVGVSILSIFGSLFYLAYNGDVIARFALCVFCAGIFISLLGLCIEILTERN